MDAQQSKHGAATGQDHHLYAIGPYDPHEQSTGYDCRQPGSGESIVIYLSVSPPEMQHQQRASDGENVFVDLPPDCHCRWKQQRRKNREQRQSAILGHCQRQFMEQADNQRI
ncbi:MAG TPA: hypothetical protein DCY89_05800 [Gammaproteobacteria bacterium]|nr:hypothetical protein [Gammaproteobacteria bacterium]